MIGFLAKKWARFIYRHAVFVLILSVIASAFAFQAAKKISVNTNLEALMPEGAPSVITLNKALRKTGSFASINIVAWSDDPKKTLDFIKAVKKKIDGEDWVDSSQYSQNIEVLERHKLLLLSLDQLQDLEKKIDKNYPIYMAHQAAKALGHDVNIHLRKDGIEASSTEELDTKFIEKFKNETTGKPRTERLFASEDGKTVILVVWPKPGLESLSNAKRMVDDSQKVIAAVKAEGLNPDVKAGVGGRIANKVAQFDAILGDVKFGLLGSVTLIALLIIFSFRSLATLPSIFIPLIIGILWTLGVTAEVIGGLNLITIFLALILFGLGIDFGIHNFSRYREERRAGKSIEQAIEVIIVDTGSASFVAALTTAVGFYSLMLTNFRAFTEFGFIAGSGVLLVYISMYSVFPALVVIMEKTGVWNTEKSGRHVVEMRRRPKVQQQKRNRIVFLTAIGLTAFSLIFAPRMQFERNFKNLEAKQPEVLREANARIHHVFPDGHDRAIIVVKTMEELKALDSYFKNYIKTDTETPTIKKVSSLLNFLPDQESQKKRHAVINRLLKRADALRAFDLDKYKRVKRYLTIDDLNLSDMPEAIRRTYIGTDSEPGYLMYVFNSISMDDSADAKKYYDDAAEIKVGGHTYHAASEGFIFVEMLAMMKADALKAIILVTFFTTITTFIFLRSFIGGIIVLVPTFLGVLLTVGIMGAFGPKLSIMNMVILPSLIGISVDNGIHIFHRFEMEGPKADIAHIMNNTGRAAVLTTLTTLFGFGGMVTASMGGLRSMGILAIIGFVCCLVMTWTLLPAELYAYQSRLRKKEGHHG